MRIRIAWGEASEQFLMKMAAWSAVIHVVALIVFSVIPRFTTPVRAPRATIAEIVPASALFPPEPGGNSPPATAAPARPPAEDKPAPPELTPSQRAEAARQATRQKAPPPKKEASPIPSRSNPAKPVEPHKQTPTPEPEPTGGEGDERTEEPAHPAPGAATAGPGISFGGAVGPGGIPSIGSSAFPYDYYRSSLVAILQSNWRRPVAPEGLTRTVTCRIQFTILKSGIVQDARVAQASGNEALDQSALRAVYSSNPLPPLPFQYGQSSVSAEVVFELTPD